MAEHRRVAGGMGYVICTCGKTLKQDDWSLHSGGHAEKLDRIRSLVAGVGRSGRRNNGMDMLADAVLRILDEAPDRTPTE